ncbi:MAG: hypothetical protein M3063_13855 [Actinomycetota bacterium]|nr:hypothetical protein [Actinomycetota bacterium]
MDGESVVGAVGHLTVPIPEGGAGEVMVAIRGGAEAYAAWADGPIAKHTQVLVISQTAPRSVIVTPFITTLTLSKE